MGFIWKYAEFTPTQISSLSLLECVQVILKGCAKALMSTDTGWSLDTTHHPSATGSVDDPDTINPINTNQTDYATTYPCCAYYFKNSISNDKFMMLYSGDYTSYPEKLPLFSSDLLPLKYTLYSAPGSATGTVSNTTDYCYMGMMCSIIKGSYNEDFGEDCSNLAFLPAHATRLLRFLNRTNTDSCLSKQRTSTNWGNWARFYWGSSTDGNCIIGIYRSEPISNFRALPTRIWGKIYGSLYNTADSDDYGAVKLWSASSLTAIQTNNFGADTVPFKSGMTTNSTTLGTDAPDSLVHFSALAHGTAGDTWLSGTSHFNLGGSTTNITTFQSVITMETTDNFNDYANCNKRINTSRFCLKLPSPIVAFNYYNNDLLEQYGIVPGCGIKGAIDQKVLTFIPNASTKPYPSGTLIDEGYLIATGAYGVCLGWDPSNDPTDNPWYVAPV